ncbi:MAG: ABC transporter ATP-binding protein [Candidatus Thorarchaeota archaeon]
MDTKHQGDNGPIIELNEVAKRFTSGASIIRAVDGCDLEIFKGEFICIMGPSGSGKTTLLNLIAGLTEVTEGEIFVNNNGMQNLSESQRALLRRNELGIIFQFYNLHEGLTTIENVQLPMLIAGVPLKNRYQRAMNLLELVNIADRGHHLPRELSGGEKQRLGIARALANKPSILLADEPTGNLDHEMGEGVIELLIELNRTQNLTVVMVTHDASLLRKGFRLLKLLDGKIIQDEIVSDPSILSDDFSHLVV